MSSISHQTPRHVSNPRRLLILSPTSHAQATVPALLQSLTGVPVSAPQTKYYTANVPIWVDKISLPIGERPIQSSTGSSSSPSSAPSSTTAAQWKTEFLSSKAQAVREAIGAVIFLSDRVEVRALKDFLKMIGEVKSQIEEERGGIGEVPGLLVLMETKGNPQRGEDDVFSAPWWEDELYAMGVIGYEVVSWDPTAERKEESVWRFALFTFHHPQRPQSYVLFPSTIASNGVHHSNDGISLVTEFGGMGRIKEALETHAWADTGGGDAEYLLDSEVNELQREMLGRSRHECRFAGRGA
ncbi:hypothetical protein Egran_06803 [Elaphomyces granulatus]|uniref:Uncharacterized protein n=1 Tax=Elaphomyces granulatus TaxID=519963 RepID=A0A232LMQ1_9EURO|nr:hypothetical protein Egran_06803 [Elaphomyces granulatus]